MNTSIKKPTAEAIAEAAELLKNGEIVAIPTETVYGLAASALNTEAIKKIFTAKNRPADNPLIVHVSDMEMAQSLGLKIPPLAERLAEKFWAGALTMIFQRASDIVPKEVSCGLDTVAVRVPAHDAALGIIRACNLPLAAPSANLSGSPSPTKAEHVFADINGKIPLIIDGGQCDAGLESTVIMFAENKIRILRPGIITAEMLSEFAEVIIDDSGSKLSPGTRYKHYSPKAQVIAVETDKEEIEGEFVINKPEAKTLYAKLRELDEIGADKIYIRLPKPEGVGLALYNRIIRAADFNIIRDEK